MQGPNLTGPSSASESLGLVARALDGFEKLTMFAEAVAGYRKKLIDAGVGPDAADAMAIEYHKILMEVAGTQIRAQLAARLRPSVGQKPTR